MDQMLKAGCGDTSVTVACRNEIRAEFSADAKSGTNFASSGPKQPFAPTIRASVDVAQQILSPQPRR
jgi:hypothetical protein